MTDNYVGKPFVDGARGPDAYDCWGLVAAIYLEEYGITLPEYYVSAMDTEKVSETMSTDRKSVV